MPTSRRTAARSADLRRANASDAASLQRARRFRMGSHEASSDVGRTTAAVIRQRVGRRGPPVIAVLQPGSAMAMARLGSARRRPATSAGHDRRHQNRQRRVQTHDHESRCRPGLTRPSRAGHIFADAVRRACAAVRLMRSTSGNRDARGSVVSSAVLGVRMIFTGIARRFPRAQLRRYHARQLSDLSGLVAHLVRPARNSSVQRRR